MRLHQPVPGIGVYFGISIARFPTFFHIASNGSNAALATLVIFFHAINAAHIKIRAIISIITVPKIHPAAERALGVISAMAELNQVTDHQ